LHLYYSGAALMAKTTPPTPRVPIQTPMFNEPAAANLTVSRTWVIFFERLFKTSVETSTSSTGGAAGPYQRTLLLKDTTVANDVADHVTVWGQPGTITKVVGVLRKTITADLKVRINIGTVILGVFTIPLAQPIDTPIEFT